MQSVYFEEAKPFDSIVRFSTNRDSLSNPVASEFVTKVDGFFMHRAFTDQTLPIPSGLEDRVAKIDLPLLLEEFSDIGARQRFIANFQKVTKKHFLFPDPNQQVFLTTSDTLSSASGRYSLTGWLPKRWIADTSPLLVDHRTCRNDESTHKHDVIGKSVLSLGTLSPLAHALLQKLVEHPYFLDDSDILSKPSLETVLELYHFAKEKKLEDFATTLGNYLHKNKMNSLDAKAIQEHLPLLRLFIQLGGKRSEDRNVNELVPSPHKTDLNKDFWAACIDLAFEGQEISEAKRDKLATFIAKLTLEEEEEEEEETTDDMGFGLFDDVAPTSSREPDFSPLQKFANENNPRGTQITIEDACIILKLMKSLTSKDTDEIGVLKGVFPELKSD